MTPDCYKAGGVETIDYLHAFLTEDEFNGFCKGNIIKYVSRANRKNGLEGHSEGARLHPLSHHQHGRRMVVMRTSARERKVFDLIKQGMPDNTITLLTGYSRAVIQAMRKDLERMEQDGTGWNRMAKSPSNDIMEVYHV